MTALQRLTIDYVDTEDRVRLRGALAGGDCVVVWLTRRLLDRLVQHLIAVLTRHADDLPAGPAVAADAPVVQEPPVLAHSPDQQWTALSVDITLGPGALQLAFRDAERSARIAMDGPTLRQWLDGLRDLYLAAEWPLRPWEGWSERQLSARKEPTFVH
jgi:hypothetical protein